MWFNYYDKVIMLEELLTGLVVKRHGTVVAEQFQCTYLNKEPFEDQNWNALEYVYGVLDELTDISVLSYESEMELEMYMYRLKKFLRK